MNDLSLYDRLSSLPDEERVEVSQFIDFLLSKSSNDKRKNRSKKSKPHFGSAKGKIKMSDDFDAPLDAFDEYMP